MHLLKFENYELTISEEAFLVTPIRRLFNADRTKYKEKFMRQMSVLFFMVDPRSSYMYIVDEDDRYAAICEQEGFDPKEKITSELRLAMDAYAKLVETPSRRLLNNAIIAADRVGTFLSTVDLTETDSHGKPCYSVSQIVTAMKQVPQLAKDLVATSKIVDQEIDEAGRARGGNESKKLFEDGI